MMRPLLAALVLALALVCVPGMARAALTQTVPGRNFEALATPISKGIRLTGDAQLVQAYPIPDQIVPAGHVTLVAQSAIVNPTFVNVPIQVELDGKFLRQIFVGYRVQQLRANRGCDARSGAGRRARRRRPQVGADRVHRATYERH